MPNEFFDKEMDVTFIRKGSSKMMMRVGAVLKALHINTNFQNYWTTIGSTVWFPNWIDNPLAIQYEGIRQHEYLHVGQFRSCGIIIMALLYLLLPLPALLSGRWFIERHPYLGDIRSGRITTEKAVEKLWGEYGWVWPRSWMREWFEKNLLR
jgi:hypothetical protein